MRLCGTLGLVTLVGVPLLSLLLAGIRLPYRDEVEEICEHAAFYKESYTSFHHASDANVRAFVEVCRETFAGLDPEAQQVLRQVRSGGGLVQALTPLGRSLSELAQRVPLPDFACGSAFERQPLDELDTPDAAEWRAKFPEQRPLRERTVRADELRAAFMRSEVVRFDARELLPAHLFNITFADLAALHPNPEEVEVFETPFGDEGPPNLRHYQVLYWVSEYLPKLGLNTPLALLVRRLVHLVDYLKTPWLSLAKVANWTMDGEVPISTIHGETAACDDARRKYRYARRMLDHSNINARRIPAFNKQLDLPRKVGIAEQVDHTFSLLWFGIASGFWHADLQDNLLIQLSGTSEVIVLAGNCSFPLPHPQRWLEWMEEGRVKGEGRPAFFHVTLRPGEGVALPAHSHHRVMSRRANRISLNSFFNPKFKQMQWPGAPRNLYHILPPETLAMRNLWFGTIASLWDTRGIRMNMHTRRMEVV